MAQSSIDPLVDQQGRISMDIYVGNADDSKVFGKVELIAKEGMIVCGKHNFHSERVPNLQLLLTQMLAAIDQGKLVYDGFDAE